jgi:hypothetical protein
MLTDGHGSQTQAARQQFDAGAGVTFEVIEDALTRVVHL